MKIKSPKVVIGLSLFALLAGCASPPAPTANAAPETSAEAATPIGVPLALPEGVRRGDEVDVLPRPVYQVPPVYPFALSREGITGRVVVGFIVGLDGTVSNAWVRWSSHKGFEMSAVDCVRQWRFEPAIKGGVPVDCLLELPITYNLLQK